MSFQIDDDGTVRNADAADPVQRLKDANRILVRQLAREQKRRKQLEAAITDFLAGGDRQRFEAAIDPHDEPPPAAIEPAEPAHEPDPPPETG